MPSQDWIDDCMHYWGWVLDGPHAHWCLDWDALPIDAFHDEYASCGCEGFQDPIYHAYWNWKLDKPKSPAPIEVGTEFSF